MRRGLVVRCPSPLPRLVFQQHYFGLGRRHRSPFTVHRHAIPKPICAQMRMHTSLAGSAADLGLPPPLLCIGRILDRRGSMQRFHVPRERLAFPPHFRVADPLFPPSSIAPGARPFHWTGNCVQIVIPAIRLVRMRRSPIPCASRDTTSMVGIMCATHPHRAPSPIGQEDAVIPFRCSMT